MFTLFGLYRLLVAQKDATIQHLQERCNTLSLKIESLSAVQPDILVEQMTMRMEALETELRNASAQKIKDMSKIALLTQQVSEAVRQLNCVSNSVDSAQLRITRFKRSNMRAALATLYSNRCQICGYDSGVQPEACAILPISAGGSNSLTNYLQLCPNHHHLFDVGKLAISDDYKLLGMHGKLEMDVNHQLDLEALHHHRKYVFKEQ